MRGRRKQTAITSQRKRQLKRFKLVGGPTPQPKWVCVVDSSILVNAAVAVHPLSVTVRVVEAAISGLYVCVLSESIREETTEVLIDLGRTRDEVDELFDPLWQRAVVVPLGAESPDLVEVVRDPGDVHVLRCALGIFEHEPELAVRPRFLISDNTRHFRPDVNWYGFRFVTANVFWHLLQETRDLEL